MPRKIGLAGIPLIFITLSLLPLMFGLLALQQTRSSGGPNSPAALRLEAESTARMSALTLKTLFQRTDILLAHASREEVSLEQVARLHPSVKHVALLSPEGFPLRRWPERSAVPPVRSETQPGTPYLQGQMLTRLTQLDDGAKVAMYISPSRLASSLGVPRRVTLDRYRPIGDKPLGIQAKLPGYPLFATAIQEGTPSWWLEAWPLGLALGAGVACWLLIHLARGRWITKTEESAAAIGSLEDELREYRSTFLSSVAKQLVTPLTHVLGLTGTLAGRWDDLSDERKRLLVDRIGANAEAMDEMVEEIMDFSRIAEGSFRLHPRACEAKTVCQAAMEKLKLAFKDHRTLFMVPEGLTVRADPRALRRVIEILLSNAIRYSPAGTLIVLRAHLSEDEVVICVDDEGPGVPPEDTDRIFGRFYRCGRQDAGPGVGLWIAKAFVTSLEGRIWVESSERGSTFSLSLPSASGSHLTLSIDDVLVGRELS